MSLEIDTIASDPVGGTPTINGSFTFQPIWITGNVVTIQYSTMPTCNLTINSVVIAAINGSGTYTYKLTLPTGNATVTCGSVTQQI
jgi:hypothetical protein